MEQEQLKEEQEQPKEFRYYATITNGYGGVLPVGESHGYSSGEDAMQFARLYVGGYGGLNFTIWEATPKKRYLRNEKRFYNVQTGEVDWCRI